jgi:hypothetical protein
MDSDLSSLSDFEEASPRMRRRVQRRVRIRFIRNREDPFELLDDREFKQRFRPSKMTVANLLEEIGPAIEPKTNRNKSINARLQLLITLRFYATGAFQQLISDYIHINQSNVSRIIKRVTLQLGGLSSQYIKMPTTNEEMSKTMFGFYAICQFPRVLGAVDCSHVKIQSPGGANAELFRNRKGYFSINVEAICDAELKLLHIIARWQGSVHDSTIFNNSPLPVEFRIGQYGNCFLLGDSGYPCKPFLLTPLLHPAPCKCQSRGIQSSPHSNTEHHRTFFWCIKAQVSLFCVGIALSTKYSSPNYCCLWSIAQ